MWGKVRGAQVSRKRDNAKGNRIRESTGKGGRNDKTKPYLKHANRNTKGGKKRLRRGKKKRFHTEKSQVLDLAEGTSSLGSGVGWRKAKKKDQKSSDRKRIIFKVGEGVMQTSVEEGDQGQVPRRGGETGVEVRAGETRRQSEARPQWGCETKGNKKRSKSQLWSVGRRGP